MKRTTEDPEIISTPSPTGRDGDFKQSPFDLMLKCAIVSER
jgi:hypothetical protein